MMEQKEFADGFRYLEISNSRAWARIALQGAHLFHYERPGKEPLLWLSRASLFAEGRAIRGGVPVCRPWFGRHPDNPALPRHGFARTSLWRLVEVDESDPDLSVVTLELQDCAQTLELWPHHFILRLRIGVGRSLELALTTRNRDRESCTITSALHSYFTVSDFDNVEIRGLENTPCS